MTDLSIDERLISATRAGQKTSALEFSEYLDRLPPSEVNSIACFSLMIQSLSYEGLGDFLKTCGLSFPSQGVFEDWLISCVENGLFSVSFEEDRAFLIITEEVRGHLESKLSDEEKQTCRQSIDRFYEKWFLELAKMLEVPPPEDEKDRRAFLVGPNGIIDGLSHNPQYRSLFLFAINSAVGWQEQLFQLKHYEEAADLVSATCFALTREGQGQLAQALLFRIISVTNGIYQQSAQINLATLLRKELKLDPALKLYRDTVPGLIRRRNFRHLAIVWSEMGAVYRQQGKLLKAAITLEACSVLHGVLKNYKSQAIARSQLADVYRLMRLLRLALEKSTQAYTWFQKSGDLMNTGHTLLTQGNIFYNLGKAHSANASYCESLSIGQQINDPALISGSLSGKARALMYLERYDEARPLLEEAIALRQRTSDKNIGIEYENLGHYYEKTGNPEMALVWFRKALNNFEQYQHGFVGSCKNNINRIEKALAKKTRRIDGKM